MATLVPYNLSIQSQQTVAGVTSNLVNGLFNETVSCKDTPGAQTYTIAAGATGVSILPPNFEGFTHIDVIPFFSSTDTDPNYKEFEVHRTDSGAKVNDMSSKGFPISFCMKAGDTALTIDNNDSTAQLVVVVVNKRINL